MKKRSRGLEMRRAAIKRDVYETRRSRELAGPAGRLPVRYLAGYFSQYMHRRCLWSARREDGAEDEEEEEEGTKKGPTGGRDIPTLFIEFRNPKDNIVRDLPLPRLIFYFFIFCCCIFSLRAPALVRSTLSRSLKLSANPSR